MRIALLTYSTRPRGGVVHTLSLAEALAERGHAVTVWSLARGGDKAFFRPVDPRVTVRLVPFPEVEETVGERIVRSIAVLGAAFAEAGGRQPVDVVHAQDCITANAVPRCIRTVHHLDAFTTPELVRCHERAIVRPYAHVCVSASVAREVERGWGLRPTVISNGIDAARFAAAAGDTRWRERLGRYVLCVGGIEPRKGTLDLVEAMALVQAQQPDLRLVVAGGETLFDYRDYRRQVEELVRARGVDMVNLGPVDHEDLPAVMAGAEAFAFPSTKEGFGLAAMEALAAGVPVVMRDLPVLREVFGSSVAFARTPVELAEQLLTATPSPTGAALAAGFTWAAAAEQHERLYRALSPS